MGWKKILILLAVIAAIHVIVITGFTGGCRSREAAAGKETGKGAAAEETVPGKGEDLISEKLAAWRERLPEQLRVLRPSAVRVPRLPAVRVTPVVPWKRPGNAALPKALSKQAERAKSVIVVDFGKRQVLWEKNSRQAVAVASLTKLMSAVLIAEKLERDPKFNMDTKVPVTKAASSVERSRVLGLREGESYSVQDLLQAMMIGSYNDAAAQLAEAVGGSVENFVKMMNDRAAAMRLDGANFNSPNGLPQGKQRINSFASASDILHLCEELMRHKEVAAFCRMSHAKLESGREVWTSNNLMKAPSRGRAYRRQVPGLIGFKTGFTNAAGSCLAFGVEREGRVIIGCVTGFPSAADRDRFCNDVIEWAFASGRTGK